MNINDLITQPTAWLPRSADDGGIVVSSRIRLARNLKDTAFPGWAGETESTRIWDNLQTILREAKALKHPFAVDMGDCSTLDRHILFERHLISRELAERKAGSGLLLRRDESLSVMVNEEDHVRMQALRPGLDLNGAWLEATTLDNELEQAVDFAFSPQLGYLTACPSNVGTGLRASVMLHVPGLVMVKEMNAVVKGMAKIGLAVRGLWGEGSEASGHLFQLSNQMTLGEAEEEIIANLEQIVLEIVEHEQNARWRLFEQNEAYLQDRIWRACGILEHARILNSKEALDLLSDLRLGINMGIVKQWPHRIVNDLLVQTQPGHLQKRQGRRLKPAERDVARATQVREQLTTMDGEAGQHDE